MPAETKITREAMLDGAIALIRAQGHEALTARSLAAWLDCSTQPLLYRFESLDALRRAAYERADALHTEYILAPLNDGGADPLPAVGMRYIRFAHEERHLFRFLFQSGHFAGRTLTDMTGDPQAAPLLRAFGEASGLDERKTRALFEGLFIAVHGYASLLANNALQWDAEAAERMLKRLGAGLMLQLKEETT